MKFLKIALRRETAMPVLGLTFASGVCISLVVARIIWTGRFSYAFLIWNLFLAWLPLVFALLANDEYRNAPQRTWRFYGLAIAWLLFLPNASYIFTDLIHLVTRYFSFWVDLVLILSCAVTGLVLSFLSLYLMQCIVARMFGWLTSWLFIGTAAALSAFGIYLGRFLRFNSWDVLFQPVKLYQGIGRWASDPMANSTSFAFPILFGTFLFIAYVMLYGLTHLKPGVMHETRAAMREA